MSSDKEDEYLIFINRFFPQYTEFYLGNTLSTHTKSILDRLYVTNKRMCHYCNDYFIVILEKEMCYRCFIEYELGRIQYKMDEVQERDATYQEKFEELCSFIGDTYEPCNIEHRLNQKEMKINDFMNSKFMELYNKDPDPFPEASKKIKRVFTDDEPLKKKPRKT